MATYGSVFTMKVKPGKETELLDGFRRWNLERRPKVSGALASFVLKPDKRPGELVGVAVFKDKESYTANANDPEQDRWYRDIRQLLESDPEWNDGVYVISE